MSNRDLVAIGTSAGGVDALLRLIKGFKAGFPASVLVTIHLSQHHQSILDELLTHAGALPARFATDGESVHRHQVYLAPPGRHLLLEETNRLRLGHGPRENNSRPAIDPMFRSIAACCGHRAIGVLLTGTLNDGASGLAALQNSGALTVVQDPKDALYAEMPLQALRRLRPDHIAPLARLPALLTALVQQPAKSPIAMSRELAYEIAIAQGAASDMAGVERLGERSVFTCPDCNGVLWEMKDGNLLRFRCHIGHAFTESVLNLALDDELRRALGSALRTLEERRALMSKMEHQAHARGSPTLANNWAQKADEFEREATVIRESIRRIDDIVQNIERETDESTDTAPVSGSA